MLTTLHHLPWTSPLVRSAGISNLPPPRHIALLKPALGDRDENMGAPEPDHDPGSHRGVGRQSLGGLKKPSLRSMWMGQLRQLMVHLEGNGRKIEAVVGGGLPAREGIELANEILSVLPPTGHGWHCRNSAERHRPAASSPRHRLRCRTIDSSFHRRRSVLV